MKHRKTTHNTPEEAFLQAAESRMDMGFDYQQLQDRLDVEEIARVGAARQAETSRTTAGLAAHPVRRPAAAVLVAMMLTTLLAVGAGGWMIARLTNQPHPPIVPPDDTGTVSGNAVPSDTSEETTTPFQMGGIEFTVDDTLIWDGVIYTRTNVMIPQNHVGDELGSVADGSVGLDDPDRTQPPFASASLLAGGSVFHRIQAYREDRYLAVLTSEGYILYMVRDTQSPDLP